MNGISLNMGEVRCVKEEIKSNGLELWIDLNQFYVGLKNCDATVYSYINNRDYTLRLEYTQRQGR